MFKIFRRKLWIQWVKGIDRRSIQLYYLNKGIWLKHNHNLIKFTCQLLEFHFKRLCFAPFQYPTSAHNQSLAPMYMYFFDIRSFVGYCLVDKYIHNIKHNRLAVVVLFLCFAFVQLKKAVWILSRLRIGIESKIKC